MVDCVGGVGAGALGVTEAVSSIGGVGVAKGSGGGVGVANFVASSAVPW